MDEKIIKFKKYVNLVGILFLVAVLYSCQKEKRYHKLRYEYTALAQSKYGVATPVYLGIQPRYEDEIPRLESRLTEKWYYEYWGLEDGQYVYFSVDIPLSIIFEMRVLIDGEEIAYKRIAMSDSHYYECNILESRGLDQNLGVDYLGGKIKFTYQEP